MLVGNVAESFVAQRNVRNLYLLRYGWKSNTTLPLFNNVKRLHKMLISLEKYYKIHV